MSKDNKLVLKRTGGFSVYIAFGSWGKPRISFNSTGIRLCLGWSAIAILFFDLESLQENNHRALEYLTKENKRLKEKLKKLILIRKLKKDESE